jgi:hypothetical protein
LPADPACTVLGYSNRSRQELLCAAGIRCCLLARAGAVVPDCLDRQQSAQVSLGNGPDAERSMNTPLNCSRDTGGRRCWVRIADVRDEADPGRARCGPWPSDQASSADNQHEQRGSTRPDAERVSVTSWRDRRRGPPKAWITSPLPERHLAAIGLARWRVHDQNPHGR